jgi:oxygen-dependent protoporphyrinogen oxidase
MSRDECDVAIVGGGVSGLTAGWQLNRLGVDVRILEAAPDVGGVARTEYRDGFVLEKGPFNIIVRSPAFAELLADFADDAPVVEAAGTARRRFVYYRGQLRMVPRHLWSLATTPLLSARAKLRLMAGVVFSRRCLAAEETICEAATRRFGPEVAEKLVSAVVAGIYGGDVRRLSLSSCFPTVSRLDRCVRSPLVYAVGRRIASIRQQRETNRGLISIKGGLGRLMAAMGKRLNKELLTQHTVREIQPADDGYMVCATTPNSQNHSIYCRRLILATPVSQAARLLQPLSPQASELIGSITSASLAVMNLGFRGIDIGHPLEGYGFLTPQCESTFPLIGVLWADSVFPHHAPPGHRLLRVFFGGSREPDVLRRSDAELIDSALAALRDLLQLRGRPALTDISRFANAIPQYHLGHAEKITQVQKLLSAESNIDLVGNYVQGVSINDVMDLAISVANDVQRKLAGQKNKNKQSTRTHSAIAN